MKKQNEKKPIDPKAIFSKVHTKKAIEICNKMIKNEQARKQTIVFIKAADGKKIRNRSGV